MKILTQLFEGIDETNGYSVLVGLLTMGMIWGAQKYIKSKPNLKSMGIPIHLLIMIFWIIITYASGMNDEPCNVSIVGKIPAGLPRIGPPKAHHFVRVFPHSLAITIVSFMLNLSLLQVFASKYNYDAELSQNLSAMGLANILGSFFGSYPACSSLSRSALIDSIGKGWSKLLRSFAVGFYSHADCLLACLLDPRRSFPAPLRRDWPADHDRHAPPDFRLYLPAAVRPRGDHLHGCGNAHRVRGVLRSRQEAKA